MASQPAMALVQNVLFGVRGQVLQKQVILYLALVPEHKQNYPFHLVQADLFLIQRQSTVNNPFPLCRANYPGTFQEGQIAPAVDIQFALLVFGKVTQSLAFGQRAGKTISRQGFQTGNPVQGLVDLVVRVAGSRKLACKHFLIGKRCCAEKILKQVDKKLEHNLTN